MAGPAALARFASSAPLNTDDRPVVTYRAPLLTYAPDSQPRERLLALLDEWRVEPIELRGASTTAQDERWRQRLAAYWTARTRFIEVGAQVQPHPDVHRMLRRVRAPLLDLLQTSPDFRPAYDPLLNMALALSSSDAGADIAAARALLVALHTTQPARPEAGQALQRLDASHRP